MGLDIDDDDLTDTRSLEEKFLDKKINVSRPEDEAYPDDTPIVNIPLTTKGWDWDSFFAEDEEGGDDGPVGPVEGDATHIGQMDLRVGRIKQVFPHNDPYYIEEIDLGTYDEFRLLATSLAPDYNMKELKGRNVVVLCNVHPSDTREVGSKSGMMLVSYKDVKVEGGTGIETKLEVVQVSDDCEPGSRVVVDGFANEPFPPSDEEVYDFILPDLKVNANGFVVYKDLPLRVENTMCEAFTKTFKSCPIKLD